MIDLGYRVIEGPKIERDFYNFTRLEPSARARGADDAGHLLRAVPTQGSPCSALSPSSSLASIEAPSRRRSSSSPRARSYSAFPDTTHSPNVPPGRGAGDRRGGQRSPTSRGPFDEMLGTIYGPGREARMRPHYLLHAEPTLQFRHSSCFPVPQGRSRALRGQQLHYNLW